MTDVRHPATDKSAKRALDKTWLLVLVVTLIAFILRIYRLDFVSLRGDEAFTVIFVQRTWAGLWKGISTIEPNPPLMYLALRIWVALAGASEFVTRYFSAFFGVLCVPLLYRLAKEMFGSPIIALIAAALIAINPYQIWHSQDVRNYTLWPALSLLALVFLWRWWREEKAEGGKPDRGGVRHSQAKSRFTFYVLRFTNLFFYVLATLTSLYTHYYDTFTLVAENIFIFAFVFLGHRWKTLARWISAQFVLVLAYTPWVLWGTDRVTKYNEASAEQGVPLLDQFSRTLATFVVSDTVPDTVKTIVWLPLALALVLVLIYLARQSRERAAFLFLWIAIPSLALYVISLGRPLFLERYLNGVAPVYYLVFAVGIAGLIRANEFAVTTSPSLPSQTEDQPTKVGFVNLLQRWFGSAHHRLQSPVLAIAILFFVATSAYALANYYFNPAYGKAPNWRALSNFIAERQQAGDIIIQNFTEMSAIYYRNNAIPVITLPKDYWATPADEKTLRQLNTEYRRLWFIPAQPDVWDPDQSIERLLSRYDDRMIDARVAEFRLQLYLTPREFGSKIIPVNARVGSATLLGYRTEGARLLHVVLYWRATQKIERDSKVFVHLTDAGDRVVAQQDRVPAFGTYPMTDWQPGDLIVDAYDLQVDAAPGTYSLVVGMYDPATLERAPAFDTNGARLPNDRVMLTQVMIPQ